MDFLNSWLQGIIIAVIVSSIIEMILPNGGSKKYAKVVLGVYVVFTIITPVVNQFLNSDFELSSILNIEDYTKKIDTYEVNSKNIQIDKTNETSIKNMYLANLKNDMKTKLEDKDYKVKQIQVEIENDETYLIKSISLSLEKKEEEKEKNKEEKVKVNEIKEVKIQIGEEKQETKKEETSNIAENEKKEIKQYLASIYEVKEKQIYIN